MASAPSLGIYFALLRMQFLLPDHVQEYDYVQVKTDCCGYKKPVWAGMGN